MTSLSMAWPGDAVGQTPGSPTPVVAQPGAAIGDALQACATVPAPPTDGPMTTLPRQAYALKDTGAWQTNYLRLAVIRQSAPVRTVDQVAADGNRTGRRLASAPGVSCFHTGFEFDAEDKGVCWRPQGLTGSADAFPASSGVTPGGRRLLAVSWHEDECQWSDGKRRGSRVTFVDVTNMNAIRYRHVLLAEPCEIGQLTSLCPVDIHVGGIAWIGRYLYVAKTSFGVLVFDTEQILQANVSDSAADSTLGLSGGKLYAYNYKYVLPLVGAYQRAGCSQLFSWLSIDRSSNPPSLVSGEYHKEGTAGKLARWYFADNGRLATDGNGTVVSADARYLGQRRVQGGFTRFAPNGTMKYYLVGKNTSSPRLFRKNPLGLEASFPWSTGTAQNLHYSPFSDNLWGLDEFDGRPVWACRLATLD